jgi:hypothetical protein
VNVARTSETLGGWIIDLVTHGSRLDARGRKRLYAAAVTVSLALVWGPVTAFIVFMPSAYVSEWSLLLPVTGAGHAVQLDSVGQASAQSLSPYANSVIDPRVNYKLIAASRPVLTAAAAKLGMRVDEFGKPRINLVEQTALMVFRIRGTSADQARAKAGVLQDAFAAELERLRADELERRELTAAEALSGFSAKLTATQRKIVVFQADARITSLEQFRELTLGIERSREQRQALLARREGLAARIQALEQALGIPPGHAGSVLALQNDAVFQQLVDAGATAAARLSEYQGRWGDQHFKVMAARENDAALHRALLARAAAIAPSGIEAALLLRLANGGLTRKLIQELVELRGELFGIDAEFASLEEQIAAHAARIEAGAEDAVALEDLQRKQQVAMAVFTTALAKLDLGKTDMFGSYPMLQTLLAPTLPEKPDTLGLKLALLGGVVGSLLVVAALVLLWIRKPCLQRILRSV